MKKTTIILVCLLLAIITVQAGNTLPLGQWEVVQITLEKNTDGRVETTTYNKTDEVNSYIRFPQAVETGESQRIVLHYPGKVESTVAGYTLEDDLLTIRSVGVVLQYQCHISNEILTLILVRHYSNNISEKELEHVTEKWVITLKQQK